jgi:hypothetical protein
MAKRALLAYGQLKREATSPTLFTLQAALLRRKGGYPRIGLLEFKAMDCKANEELIPAIQYYVFRK